MIRITIVFPLVWIPRGLAKVYSGSYVVGAFAVTQSESSRHLASISGRISTIPVLAYVC